MTSCSTATGTPGTTAAAATCSRSRWKTGALVDLTPGGDDAPPFNLGGEDWGVAPGRPGGVRREEGREGRGLAHERRALRGARRRRAAEARVRLARLRQRLPLQPGWPLARVSLDAARRLRGRPLPARGLRPDERRTAHAHRVLRPLGRRRGFRRPTRRLSSSPPRTGACRRCSRCPRRAEPSRRFSRGRARSGTLASRATDARSSRRTPR